MADDPGRLEKALVSILDNGSRLQGPAVEKYVWRIRRAHPEDSPAQIVERMEKTFLTAVTGSGGAAGATAAVPGVGTVASVAAVGAETAFFVEASALLTLSIAAVHGIAVHDHEQRRALVLAVALGESGREIVGKTLGRGNIGKVLTSRIPGANLGGLNKKLIQKFVTKYAAKRGAVMLGTMLPAGIGAVVGGAGNRVLGKGVVKNAREAFGPPPLRWQDAPGVVDAD
ncbi:membrane protein [Rhodococcus sp. MEB064]|uniref:membrane protein n=1 Tax=Rhodococcus sp. MEB064 TaxID=1587522 RepID=UPI0005ABE4F1|nr:membrane protein [Rhodococcus sp. MEB064]KIQ17158.1 membrane protein [Rhodococcus sp. MEB064]